MDIDLSDKRIWIIITILVAGILVVLFTADSGIRDQNILTINVQGNGTTNPEPGEYKFEHGEEATVNAVPEENWEFIEWTGDHEATEKVINIEMKEDIDITAIFEEKEETVNETEEENEIQELLEEAKQAASDCYNSLVVNEINTGEEANLTETHPICADICKGEWIENPEIEITEQKEIGDGTIDTAEEACLVGKPEWITKN